MKINAKTIKIILLCLLIIIPGMIFAADGFFLKKKYLEPWESTYYQQFEDPRLQLIAHGVLAANSHNLQSWSIQLDPQNEKKFELFLEVSRRSPEVDPYSTQLTISQGTFLEYLRIAGKKLGYFVNITLFPEGEYDDVGSIDSMMEKPVASIEISPETFDESNLYDAMFIPDTHRLAYEEIIFNSTQLESFQNLNNSDIQVRFYQDLSSIKKIHEIVYTSGKIEANLNRVYEENAKLLRTNEWSKNKYRYGFSLEGSGTRGFTLHAMQGLLTVFPFLNSEKANYDAFLSQIDIVTNNTYIWAMIYTSNNSRTNQVETGMLYSQLLLQATSMGFSMHPMSQALEEYAEMEEMRLEIHDEFAPENHTIQMLIRIGISVRDTPPTMRMDVMDLII